MQHHSTRTVYSSSTCGLLQDRLLLINNYGKHIYWIFIKGLSHTEVCLRAAARSRDLIAPVEGIRILTRMGQHGLRTGPNRGLL